MGGGYPPGAFAAPELYHPLQNAAGAGGESSIASKVSPLFASENPTAAIYCKIGESEIRVTARAATEAEAETACDARIAEFRKILGPNAYDVDVPGLEYTVVHLLQQKGCMLPPRSCTGGLVAEKSPMCPAPARCSAMAL